MKRSVLQIIAVILCAALLSGSFSVAAAAGAETDPDEVILQVQNADKPKISGSHYVAKGKKITLTAGEEVTWKSSDSKVATVSKSGVVKGVKAGTVKITAKSKATGKKETWKITVTPQAVTKVTITASRTELNLTDKKTVTLKASAAPSGAAQSFTWKSSDPGVATVSSKGKVTAVAEGTAKITVTATDGSKKKASIKIKVTGGKEEKPDKPVKIGIINLDPAESGYREKNVQDLNDTFTAANGYDAKFATAPTIDKQLEAAKGFITDGVKYLLICPAESGGWEKTLKNAKDNGVRVILYDRMIECDPDLYTAAVVSSYSKEGENAVKWLENQKLKEYLVIHIQGMVGSDAQIGRSKALDAKCKSADNWTMVAQAGTSWFEEDGYRITQSAIKAGKKFNVIYAENDGMAKGAVQALDEAGITHGVNGDVIIVGFDCNKWALRKLLAGEWNADVQCSPFQGGAIDQIIRTLESGGTVTGLNNRKQYFVPEKVFDARTITQKDIDKYGLGD